jgi:hypothetical protein
VFCVQFNPVLCFVKNEGSVDRNFFNSRAINRHRGRKAAS